MNSRIWRQEYNDAVLNGDIKSAKKIVIVPKRKIKARHKIVYTRPAYLLGLFVFKKGSKIRAYLKKKL